MMTLHRSPSTLLREVQTSTQQGLVVISPTDPADPDVISGGPHRVLKAVQASHPQAAIVWPQGQPWLERAINAGGGRVSGWLRHRIFNFEGSLRALEHRWPGHAREAVFRRARWKASRVEQALRARGLAPELLFGCFVPWALFEIRPDVPLIYYTDASSYEFHRTYHNFMSRSQGFKDAAEAIERDVMRRAIRIGVASENAKRWIMEGYDIPCERIRVIPMGANVVPDQPLDDVDGLSAPSRADVRLMLVASDYLRKRTDFTIDVVEALRRAGCEARLTLIGPGTAKSEASAFVDHLGALKLSEPGDRRTHQQALAECHFLMLLSEAEAFGVPPAEAAHFGRPSVVTDVGGLPTVVRDGQTGLVVPPSTSAEEIARRMLVVIDQPSRYKALSRGALERARSVLNWNSWQDGLRHLISDAIELPSTGACPANPAPANLAR